MAKRRPPSFPKKSARDQAIDKALLAAGAQVGPNGSGSIIIRLSGKADARIANPPKTAKPKPAATAANPKSAMALALTKVGLAPTLAAAQPKPAKSAPTPAKSVAAPAPAKQPPMPQQPKAKTKPPKAKAAKKTKKQKTAKQSNFQSRESIQRDYEEQIRQDRRATIEEGRAERQQDRLKKAALAIANIGQSSPDELVEMWRENITQLDSKHGDVRALARDCIDAIEGEWTRRSILARLNPDYFKWPSTKAAQGNGSFAALDHAEGILGYLGYHVGKTGEQSSARRQALLARVFEGALPPINGPDYMREWHRSGSAIRLEKMAVSIASLVRSAKRRDADYSVAIEHWEEDLKFLHRAYYIGRFGFDWPGNTSGGLT
jgi:hypothetical protein